MDTVEKLKKLVAEGGQWVTCQAGDLSPLAEAIRRSEDASVRLLACTETFPPTLPITIQASQLAKLLGCDEQQPEEVVMEPVVDEDPPADEDE